MIHSAFYQKDFIQIKLKMKKIFICIFNFAIISGLKAVYYIRVSFRGTNIIHRAVTRYIIPPAYSIILLALCAYFLREFHKNSEFAFRS